MKLLLTLSARNLFRHRGRSLVVGLILFLGALVMTVGNGVLSGMDRGLSKNITDGFLGHVVVMSDKQEDDNILFLVMGKSIAPLSDAAGVEAVLAKEKGLFGYVPVGKNAAMALNEDGGNPSYAYLLGVDWERYRRVFPNNLKEIEGAREPGEGPFVLLPQEARKQSFDLSGTWYHPKGTRIVDTSLPELARKHRASLPVRDEMVLMGFSEGNSSSDVRVPIRGVIRYPALNNLWGHFAFVDIASYRQCMGYVNPTAAVQLDSAQNALLTGENLDELFGGGDVGAAALATVTDSVKPSAGGAWNLVLVRLKPGQEASVAAKRIDAALKEAKVQARAVPWNKASGPVGAMAMLIRGALFVFVMLIFVVAAIIVMNTLSMAAMERAGEIGMMRAIGAGRHFVRALFLFETLILSLAFGGLGIVVGSIAVLALAQMGFTTDNDFLQMVYGGETFQPFLRLTDYGLALVQLLATSAIAVFYPTLLASRITPLERSRGIDMLLAKLALRNIGRHLRRSLFLGSAIALGTAVLVAANGFAHGISVVLFDKVMVFVAGHAGVFASESGSQQTQIFRDGAWLRQKLSAMPEVRRVDEAVGVFARALGNGKSDNTILVGVDTRQLAASKDRTEFEETFRIVQGSWQAMNDSTIPLPALLGVDKAKALNVKLGDQVRLRFSNVNGQNQAGKATVVGIFETDNMFMQAPLYVGLAQLRDLLGYRPEESSGFNLVLHNPKADARRVADTIQKFIVPQVASIPSRLGGAPVRLFGLKSDSATRAQWMKGLGVPDSLQRDKNLVVIPSALALSQKLSVGDTLALAWERRYGPDSGRTTLTISSVAPTGKLPDSVIVLRAEGFFRTYNSQIPKRQNLSPAFDTSWAVREWNLLPRAATTDEYRKQMAELSFGRGLGPVVSVRTMYEAASDILKLENVLNVVTLWAVLVLFFIILIGVLNTLRMTIRERTREIGTLRAIGFQARQVLGLFLFETLYLALFSGAVGVVLGFGLMKLLSSFTIHASGNPMGVLLVNGHLYFSPTVTGTLGGVVLIAVLSLLTAWLPARAAAKLSPADALRHHE